jgi:glutathione S-transferase
MPNQKTAMQAKVEELARDQDLGLRPKPVQKFKIRIRKPPYRGKCLLCHNPSRRKHHPVSEQAVNQPFCSPYVLPKAQICSFGPAGPYSPGACSLSPHIALLEAGIAHDLVKVDLKSKQTENGGDFLTISPKGQVPVLVLNGGEQLTEGAVIVQAIADKSANHKLAPAAGTIERYRLQEWLNFIGAELHKNFSPLFAPTLDDNAKTFFRNCLLDKFKYVDEQLADKDYLMGDLSVADGYLYVILRWADGMKLDLGSLKNLMAYKARVAARPKVQEALKSEGLA